MRKGATGISYRCRLITLLLILLVVYISDASQVSTLRKSGLNIDLDDINFPPNPREPSVLRRYYIQSQCSGMFVRIKLKPKRRQIDASGTLNEKYTSIIMESIGMNGRVRLKGEQSGRYICFTNNGKRLKARMNAKSRNCDFFYNVTRYQTYQFRLAENEQWYISFNKKKGKALPGYKWYQKRFKDCINFTLKPVDTAAPKWTPSFFDNVPDDYDPEKVTHDRAGHRIRHLNHRKMQRRRRLRNRNRKSRKRKPAS